MPPAAATSISSAITPRAAKAMVRIVYPRAAHVIAVSDGVVDDLAANFRVERARMKMARS